MSKNFEEEYKEYLNAQAPDLWARIEAGVDTALATENIVSISAGKSKGAKKKRQIRYQHYRMIASVAACLFALLLIVPVYFLTRNSGKSSDNATAEAPMMLTDATIQNIEVANEESAEVTEESAPMKEAADGITEIAIETEETEVSDLELAQVTEEVAGDTHSDPEGNEEESDVQTQGEKSTQVATEETAVTEEDGILEGMEEESVPAEEEMQVTILDAGTAQEGGVMYKAAVVGSTSSASISLFVLSDSSIVFEAEKTYNVTVEMSEDGSYYEVVTVTE